MVSAQRRQGSIGAVGTALGASTISLICVMLEFARGESSGANLETSPCSADRQDQPIETVAPPTADRATRSYCAGVDRLHRRQLTSDLHQDVPARTGPTAESRIPAVTSAALSSARPSRSRYWVRRYLPTRTTNKPHGQLVCPINPGLRFDFATQEVGASWSPSSWSGPARIRKAAADFPSGPSPHAGVRK